MSLTPFISFMTPFLRGMELFMLGTWVVKVVEIKYLKVRKD